jgi:hypothetical protein
MKDPSPRRARAVSTIAYLFTFPLVMNYRDMYRQTIDPSSPAFTGGFGTWRHVHMSKPRTSGVGRPREAVVYSSIWLDLRAEPWWCAIEEVPPDVSFTGRVDDLWGMTLKDCGALPRANKPLLVSAPARIRDVPREIEEVVQGESAFVALQTETRWRDPYRLPGDGPAPPDIVLDPVSSHLDTTAPRSAGAISWWPWHDDIAISDEYWSCANFVLSLTTPSPEDRRIHDRIAEIGVVAGDRWDVSAFADDVLEAIRSGMDEALSDLLEAAGECGAGGPPGPFRRADLDRDYFARALWGLRSANYHQPSERTN